jgi:hypothetical protein
MEWILFNTFLYWTGLTGFSGFFLFFSSFRAKLEKLNPPPAEFHLFIFALVFNSLNPRSLYRALLNNRYCCKISLL